MAIYGRAATYAYGERTVTFDSSTALWAGRMLVGEGYAGAKGIAILWATMNRYMYSKHKWPSYLAMIRSFSQPINDAWLPGGAKFEKYKKYNTESARLATSLAAVERRRRIRKMEWKDLPQSVKTTVTGFFMGTWPYPEEFKGKKYNNFASYPGVDKKWPGGIWYGKEYFLEDQAMPAGQIQVLRDRRPGAPATHPDDRTVPQSGGAGGALLLIPALLLGAYAFAK